MVDPESAPRADQGARHKVPVVGERSDGTILDETAPTIKSLGLLKRHEDLIFRESAISIAIATERGYRSISSRAELTKLGFSTAQCRTPALLLPVFNVYGEIASYQLRPDAPRIGKDGRIIKYETPGKSRMLLDVPRRVQPLLRDPRIDLMITEGIRKADSAVSNNLACIDLLGVWNWRGANELGGKTALADWESIALNGRKVLLVFDSDVMTKTGVHFALHRLKVFLESRHAHVHVIYLPERGSP